MIILTDDRIVNTFEEKFGIKTDHMIYGSLEVAKRYWTKFNKGTEVLPYLSFFRRVKFHEDFKSGGRDLAISITGKTKDIRFTRIQLEYEVNIISDKVIDQIEYFRNYIFWANESPVIKIIDFEGNELSFGVKFEDPEDNSDLESEEEVGRIVRSTFTFTVGSMLTNINQVEQGKITKALLCVHLYDGVENEFVEDRPEEEVTKGE